jgi:hypothetical protein
MRKKMIPLIPFFLFFVTTSSLSQVNLQSGASQYSVPLYTYSDPGNRIGTSVALIYTAGNGLKVSEIPSAVGAGWSLEAGGFIQRIQHGEADDQRSTGEGPWLYPVSLASPETETNFQTWVSHYYPDGRLYANSEFRAQHGISSLGGYTPMFTTSTYPYQPNPEFQADREQDVFAFSFNGRHGYFIIGTKNQNNVNEIRTLYDSKLRIEKVDGDFSNSNNIRTTISEFQITDEYGIKYIFKDAEVDQVCKYDLEEWYRNADGGYNPNHNATIDYGPPITIPYFKVTRGNTKNGFTKNKWYLSEIINPLTNTKITFEYEDYEVDIQGNKTSHKSVTNNNVQFNVSIERIKGTLKRLKRIVLSQKESIEFVYSSSYRSDITTDKALQKIRIMYDNAEKYDWSFTQGYFVKNEIKSADYVLSDEQKVWARLALLNVKKNGPGGIAEPAYGFDYYFGNETDLPNSAVPPLFSFYQDNWGYYNVGRYGGFYSLTTHSSSFSNVPYEPYSGNLLPRDVFEAPLSLTGYYQRPTLEARNGVLKSVTNPLGGKLIYTYEQNSYNYGTDVGYGGVRVSTTAEFDGINHSNDRILEYKYVKADGITTSSWGTDVQEYQKNIAFRIHKPCDNKKFPGINYGNLAKSFAANLNSPVSNTFGDALGLTLSGLVENMVVSAIISDIIDAFQSDWTEISSVENSSVSYKSHNLLPFQYSRVEVINKLGTGNTGKTIYEFTSPDDVTTNPLYAIDVQTLSFPYSSVQRCGYWLYGMAKKITVLDKDGKFARVTENVYTPIKYPLLGNEFLSRKWDVYKRIFGCDFWDPSIINDQQTVTQETYSPICGRIELASTKDYIYNNVSPQGYTFTETDYQYSTNNYLANKTTTHNSKGELIETNTYYPQDYTMAGLIQTMNTDNVHMINAPILSQTLITKAGSTKYLLSGALSEYGYTGNGDIKVIKTYTFRNDQPLLSTIAPFSATQFNPNSSYFQSNGSVIYGANGNVSQINSDRGKASTIYDYDNKLPVATIANADIDDVAYSSFEGVNSGGVISQQDFSGGWTISPGSTIETIRSVTGKYSFSGRLDKTVLHPGNYTITMWGLSWGTITVNGQTGSIMASIGDWRLFQWKLSNVGTVTVLADNADEVRLYPSNARMTSTTYEPLVGKTSECNENNRITYYEYDGLGRLQFVRDENKNIVKMYEYNYKH